MNKNMYPWPYLKNVQRGEQLAAACVPEIEASSTFLDINCGFAPLFPAIERIKGDELVNYLGFDASLECIEHNQTTYKRGQWMHCTDQEFMGYKENIKTTFDFIIFLGVTSGKNEWESFDEVRVAKNLISLHNPRFVLLESSDRIEWRRIDEIANHCIDWKMKLSKEGSFTMGVDHVNKFRKFELYAAN